ncbi:MAG: hypothetical protein K2P64_13415 [Lachnospiraceae bacterium]|nr:hypothetical protein [Lachnospiraceae bacterium]
MQIKIRKKVLYNGSWKRMLYILCFCFLCVIDQRVMTCAPNGGGREIFRDSTGAAMAVLILSHYKWADIVKYKKIYFGWSILAAAGLPVLFVVGKEWLSFPEEWLVILFDILIWGYVIIATFTSIFPEKRRPVFSKKIMTVWLLMMLLMVFSRSDLWWPLCYLIMFGCFYLTDFDEAEREDMFQGALSGIILAFFLFQGLSFLYRPFDQVRYVGWYTNCNNNALFYLSVLAAVLTKLYCAVRGGSGKWLRAYYFLGVGVVLSFIVLTIGRAAWIASFIIVFSALFFMGREKKVWLRRALALALCVCLTFPVCFAAARYIPPLRHHPIWFEEEWNENKVHSWDPWNSEKYIDMDEFLDTAGGRIVQSVKELFLHLMPAMKVQAAQDRYQPLMRDDEYRDGFTTRSAIYKYFWNDLNWRGHKDDEIGFRMLTNYWIGHAHNIILQFGTNFGIPVMILFAGMLIGTLYISIKRWAGNRDGRFVGSFLWMMIPLSFGMFEFCWGAGSLIIFMIFFSWGNVLRKEI